jgi:LmbE family N-acetylglucosaminyl deacetylase
MGMAVWSMVVVVFLGTAALLYPRLTGPKSIMVVAHPDDEFIFGGEALLRNPNDWYVVVVTHGPGAPGADGLRQLEFSESMRAMGIAEDQYEMLDFVDGKDQLGWDRPRLLQRIQTIIRRYRMTTVASHNVVGEYGHPQHRMCHETLLPVLTHVFCTNARSSFSERRAHLYDHVLYRSQLRVLRGLREMARQTDLVPIAYCPADTA